MRTRCWTCGRPSSASTRPTRTSSPTSSKVHRASRGSTNLACPTSVGRSSRRRSCATSTTPDMRSGTRSCAPRPNASGIPSRSSRPAACTTRCTGAESCSRSPAPSPLPNRRPTCAGGSSGWRARASPWTGRAGTGRATSACPTSGAAGRPSEAPSWRSIGCGPCRSSLSSRRPPSTHPCAGRERQPRLSTGTTTCPPTGRSARSPSPSRSGRTSRRDGTRCTSRWAEPCSVGSALPSACRLSSPGLPQPPARASPGATRRPRAGRRGGTSTGSRSRATAVFVVPGQPSPSLSMRRPQRVVRRACASRPGARRPRRPSPSRWPLSRPRFATLPTA